MIMKKLIICLLALSLAACSKKIDGSSEDAFKRSVDEMTEGMTSNEKYEFGKKLGLAASTALGETGEQRTVAMVLNPQAFASQLREALDGKSMSEIEDLADVEIERRRELQIKKVKDEMASFERQRSALQDHLSVFGKVKISNAQITNEIISDDPDELYVRHHLNFDVTNDSSYVLNRFIEVNLIAGQVDSNHEVDIPSGEIDPGSTQKFQISWRQGYRKSEGGEVKLPDWNDVTVKAYKLSVDGLGTWASNQHPNLIKHFTEQIELKDKELKDLVND